MAMSSRSGKNVGSGSTPFPFGEGVGRPGGLVCFFARRPFAIIIHTGGQDVCSTPPGSTRNSGHQASIAGIRPTVQHANIDFCKFA